MKYKQHKNKILRTAKHTSKFRNNLRKALQLCIKCSSWQKTNFCALYNGRLYCNMWSKMGQIEGKILKF